MKTRKLTASVVFVLLVYFYAYVRWQESASSGYGYASHVHFNDRTEEITAVHIAALREIHNKTNGTKNRHCYPTFELQDDFSLPHPYYYRDLTKILSFGQKIWLEPLKDYLRTIHPAHTVTIVAANDYYTPNLLNWLISAHFVADPPLENILTVVFSKSRTMYEMLRKRNISCILVRLKSVVVGWSHGVGTVWMTRLALMRLINYWGYDVQHFDTDAVVLRNPQPLFDHYAHLDYDIIGSRGRLSKPDNDMWGFAICMGVVLFRSTPKMEHLWHLMSGRELNGTNDDQKRLNFALNYTGLQWGSKGHSAYQGDLGVTRHGLKVAVLPTRYICRETCDKKQIENYYVWHEFGGGHNSEMKREQNSKSHVWFLRSDWEELTGREDRLIGRQWLHALAATNSILHSP